MEPTPIKELDRAVAELNDNKDRWAGLSISARISILRQLLRESKEVAESQVRAATAAKGIDWDAPQSAEEWLGGPALVLRNLRMLAETLEQIQDSGRPQLQRGAVHTHADGRVIVKVFPENRLDKLVLGGFKAEVWMDPEVDVYNLPETMAVAYQVQNRQAEGKVALVLGAGNVASIGPMDVLYKLFVENQVCVLKMNPVNEYLGPYVERGFRTLVNAGFLRVVYGGAKEGDHLVHHQGIDEIHITGSDKIHDIIVWGPGKEGAKNKKAGKPKMKKRITSELGCVTPVIVTPGEWSKRELRFQAENVATQVANNGSFNCNAAKILFTWEGWPQRQAFLDEIEHVLRSVPTRMAYYPGSDGRYDAFLDEYPQANPLGHRTETSVPWTLITGVDPSEPNQGAFNREAWCGVLAEAALPASDPEQYLRDVVAFCNDHVWGTLSCSLVVDPRTRARLGGGVERAVADLRYGSVVVNHWGAISYGLVISTWGAHPGHTLDDIGSGIGVVHNTLMFDKPQKSVIYGPFLANPKPPWFVTHRQGHRVARNMANFEFAPSYLKIPKIAVFAMRG